LQVLFAILLAALGIAQAQMSFPDITQAASAIERVFATVDRTPSIDASAAKGDLTNAKVQKQALENSTLLFETLLYHNTAIVRLRLCSTIEQLNRVEHPPLQACSIKDYKQGAAIS
jgi:hypothetical protein